MQLVTTHSSLNNLQQVDRLGVIASVLCAIHCAITPILLILLPTFGKAWSHPATHWGMAIIVIPIALFMMLKSYKKHAKKKVLYIGSMGILLIIVGAILPYVESSPEAVSAATAPVIASTESSSSANAEAGITPVSTCANGCCTTCATTVANETAGATPATAASTCVDGCCPSFVINEQGEKSLHIPAASIVTTLGGLFLIALHVMNLCGCSSCKKGCQSQPSAA